MAQENVLSHSEFILSGWRMKCMLHASINQNNIHFSKGHTTINSYNEFWEYDMRKTYFLLIEFVW